MTVKEMHSFNASEIERYINRKTNERFTLDYSDVHSDRFSESFSKYQKIRGCQVTNIWPLVSHEGRAVLVIEYDERQEPQ